MVGASDGGFQGGRRRPSSSLALTEGLAAFEEAFGSHGEAIVARVAEASERVGAELTRRRRAASVVWAPASRPAN